MTLLGGGPFFTSVPSGVGGGRDCLFRSNEHYRAVLQQEKRDGRAGAPVRLAHGAERALRVGVSQLRHFLERLQQRYLENVPTIARAEREHARRPRNCARRTPSSAT